MTAAADPKGLEERVLVLAPTGRDAALAAVALEKAGIAAFVCGSPADLCAAIEEGAGCALVTEESLTRVAVRDVTRVLSRQPPWSDFPLIVFSAQDARTAGDGESALAALGNVAVLDRPVRVRTMLSGVKAALRARRRQYEARKAIRERDQFLAMLGHELRNPLAAILLAAEIMDRAPPGEKSVAALARQREIVGRQARHLSRLVDDLLEVSRVSSGKIVLQRTRVDLTALVRQCVHDHRTVAAASGVSLSFEVHPAGMWVDGDPLRLEQVFNNLLTNAIKYTPRGGAIEVQVEGNASGTAVVRVRDDGVGIAPDMLVHVFDMFTQVDQTFDRSRGGMGIGLTLVKSLVELHGGIVRAASAGLGKGSEFSVELQTVPGPDGQQLSSDGPVVGETAFRRIVLVEDSLDIRESFRTLLEQSGHEVNVAEDGIRGLREILARKPALAVVDLGLPGMDGYEVARQVRAALGTSIRLIALSGYGQPEDKRRALEAGFDTHLTKPVDLRSFMAALDQLEARTTSGT